MPNTKSKPCPNSAAGNLPSEAALSDAALSDMSARIIRYLQAGYAGLYLVSSEEQRVEAEIKAIAGYLSYHLRFWSVVDGLVDGANGHQTQANDPLEALQTIEELPDKTLILLRDFHLFLQDPNPILLRKFKDVLLAAKTRQKPMVILGCRLILPPELEREFTIVEFALPGAAELRVVLGGIMDSADIKSIEHTVREKAIDAARGLTTIEAENAFALSVVESQGIDPVVVAREKAQTVKKNGLLELIESKEDLDSIGGLDVLKTWLLKRRNAFGDRARAYRLPVPKGLLILGIAGTGKSLTSKATAKVFGVPLLKLDAGRIFAGLVGQSEANLRSVIQTAEAIAPCCLWIDELEKGFSGSKSSGATDGGTSSRVFGSFLSWMQEKTAPVFVVATANDVTQLPPEMLRKGRWDELFFVDLPNEIERQAIWRIVIARYQREPNEFDLMALAKATEGLTGSEIEQAFVESLYMAFDEENAATDPREPTDMTIATVLTDLVPLSKLMAEQIAGLRNWASGRARYATTIHEDRRIRKLG